MHFDYFKNCTFNLKNRQRGFTLVEVLVVVAILGILIAIAMPSFTATIRRFRADAIRDDLLASLQLARSEAMRSGLPVTITRTPTSATCAADTSTAGVWTCGWQIFDGANNLIQQSTVPIGFSVSETSAALTNTITANRRGQFDNAVTPRLIIAPIISGTATLSDPSANAVCLGVGGKITKVKHTTGDVACP